MKPRSIIFIIVAAVLIIGGVITCFVCSSIASSKNIELLSDTVDANGNAITTDGLGSYGITKLVVDMDDVNVNIIGSSEKSYVEFVNINPARYEYTVSGYTMSLKTINPYNVTSLLKIRKNSSGFSGLRSYVFLNKYKDAVSEVNIYLADDISVSEMNVKTDGGNITVNNLKNDCMYQLTANNGNVTVDKIETLLDTTIKINKGELSVSDSSVRKTEFTVDCGDVRFENCDRSHYYVSCKSGIVYFDDENQGDIVEGIIYPDEGESVPEENKGEEGDENNEEDNGESATDDPEDIGLSLPDEVKGTVNGGNVYVTTEVSE